MGKAYLIKTKEIDIDGEKITLVSYDYGTQKKIGVLANEGKTSESADLFLISTVKDWSLTNEKDEKLAITEDVLNSLSGDFVNKILKEALIFNNISEEEIKNLGGRSEQ